MAGIEQIIVHSKSYVVRWIQVPEHHSISWSLQPAKKSINFGIFKHPGTRNGTLPTEEIIENNAKDVPSTPALDGAERPKPTSRRASVTEGKSDVLDKLHNVGIKSVAWAGRCEADKVAMGRYDVPTGEGGAYGLVFDNTFSKQTSKTVTLVLMTHPTNAPPKSGHHLHYSQAFSNQSPKTVSGKSSNPSIKPANDSSDSLTSNLHRAVLEDPRPHSKRGVESKGVEGTTFYTGTLYKRRRKKGQGHAKRFFSLDFTSSTLSYYRNRHSSALRGAVPLSLCAVGVDDKTREFTVDSGAEVWHLKSRNKKDYEGWREALDRASSAAVSSTPGTPMRTLRDFSASKPVNPDEEREWARVEQLVSKVSGTRDALRGLAKDTDPKYSASANSNGLGLTTSGSSSNNASPTSHESASQYFPDMDDRRENRRPFWKRAPSADRSPSALFRRSVSAQLAVPSASLAGPSSPQPGSLTVQKRPSGQNLQSAASQMDMEVHERCMALLRDLNKVVGEFSDLVAESKTRRQPPLLTSNSRMSLESIDDQEFFDANDGGDNPSQLLNIRRSSDFDKQNEEEDLFDDRSEADSDTSSDAGEGPAGSVLFSTADKSGQSPLFPVKLDQLPPLPLPKVKRRTAVPGPRQPPPSIIGFLRKNAGKDLSQVAMPVTANEPTSLLQRLAESIEYPQLLDAAAGASTPAERLMYVSAFAVSFFSYNRVKERALRKPFNPMLGETFELVREDMGFRFVAEKVSHHPVRMACQAESLANGGWCYAQSPKPEQKFWGKSVELNNDGRARVILHASGERFSWSQATCFLRNVIAGEKYVEPVQTMTIQSETNGMRAVVSFKAGGMFSGRSEEVNVQLFEGESPSDIGLVGKWTDSLKRTDTDETIWKVGALVPNATKVYGFTTFAAALNEITEVEADHLPPTDSRLRPDQQALEAGDVDKAEGLKARLEERQRARRKVLESHGQSWKPQFFEKVTSAEGEEEVWMLKQKDGYWDRRAASDWTHVQEVFEL
ncbi:Putative oxysterol-binding protein [Septoria linicola]|uniref:Oxysterol-binding protein n=1 Tax=Septoria linicola TaxID=215465 RepID=A0A9Q9ELW2_9PEZI|nr:putative oxysterol-binding protein [Septoria linicola]USW53838.1 Putative oxysterol-binding protein [Septoria linicola]